MYKMYKINKHTLYAVTDNGKNRQNFENRLPDFQLLGAIDALKTITQMSKSVKSFQLLLRKALYL